MDSQSLRENFSSSQTIGKSVCRSAGGIVAAQHRLAAEVGAQILAEGGNAIDAAIATSFAIGVVEPWMSGLAGGGAMVIYDCKKNKSHAIDYGMRSSKSLDPTLYPLAGGTASDLFPWRLVKDDRNLHGPGSIAVPGLVDGVRIAHENFATKSWVELVQPAVDLAMEGPIVDWNTSLMIAGSAKLINLYDTSRDIYFRDGFPIISQWTATLEDHLDFSQLAQTLRQVAEKGPRELYDGDLARAIVADMQRLGGSLTAEDLYDYRAMLVDPLDISYRDAMISVVPGLTAGATLADALRELEHSQKQPKGTPDARMYAGYANALKTAYATRMANMGDDDSKRGDTCTTHFSVVDQDGNMVAMTQTLLSAFGSKVTLPSTGILMNNGIMWFDPEQGKPNSLGADKKCLMNVCPAIGHKGDMSFAVGASGGRKIMPAVMQLTSFLCDYDMDLEQAFHHPRIDMSGGDMVVADHSLEEKTKQLIAAQHPLRRARRTNYPYSFACPSAVARSFGENTGMTEIMSPWGDAISQDRFCSRWL
ncbi:MAG: gamma-glutamyltransferase [Proteobacteria bacterium]|nr:gamma-glutamyltransferase [Pseudomonadota bacterium]